VRRRVQRRGCRAQGAHSYPLSAHSPLALPSGPALWPCPLALPSGPALWPCPLALPSGPALWPCPLARPPLLLFCCSYAAVPSASPSAAWAHGCMGAWAHGCMGAWVHGCMGTWVHGCMGAWVHGCMGAWAHGRMGVWVYGGGSPVARLRPAVALAPYRVAGSRCRRASPPRSGST